ncbi:Glycosyltransferase involved in cell wall bisynthesis [Microbulbifer donghaiensis]|uniref:Glycosyltransferase involved in cell wall bisynthesis n=1 Tax=Microbulbifer donghaiensis TaxID=494016 RepID=A0A1M4WA52_9GAMM|nr:glycosyltransferase [Microbulbifer donghaiensis]SHE78089.1 Glycosyltransferase involved in cell wall bisynthesis [Microbulbifer donghaiensis]
MKIVQILPDLEADIAGKAAVDFAHELVRLGHESIVISGGGELVARLTLRGSQHIQMPFQKKSVWSLRLAGRLRRLLQELQADVVHVNSYIPARITLRAWRGMPEELRPRLVTGAADIYPRNSHNGIIASGERVIATSRRMADQLQERCGHNLRTSPQVVHRGVNTREFDRQAPISGHWQLRLLNHYPQLEGKNWLLMPASLSPENEQATFLQVLATLSRQREDVFGLVVGSAGKDGEKYARKLEQQALDLGLSDKVLFLGERRDMRELYASSQITYQFSADNDSSAIIAAEALAMNCPVIAYEDGGAAEVLQQCFPQGLVARNNMDALVQASLQILARPQPIAFRGFSHEDSAAKTLAVYRELCETV